MPCSRLCRLRSRTPDRNAHAPTTVSRATVGTLFGRSFWLHLHEILHLRGDIRNKRFEAGIDKMIDRLHKESCVREQASFLFEGLTGTVRSFHDRMVMRFPRTQDCGTVIRLEPEVARQLNTFMNLCRRRIDG